mmetsp:Transcript_13099/g.19157  ORF Transcript_13099/g.19157 Transcript_13099/m.19157 type:complete len:92 (-) Transcript_13099:1254-1529(-)
MIFINNEYCYSRFCAIMSHSPKSPFLHLKIPHVLFNDILNAPYCDLSFFVSFKGRSISKKGGKSTEFIKPHLFPTPTSPLPPLSSSSGTST